MDRSYLINRAASGLAGERWPILDGAEDLLAGVPTALAEAFRTSQQQLSSMREILDILYESISNTRDVIGLILVAVTSRQGFGFNRAFFLEPDGDRLRARLGIGPASPEDANRIWSRMAEKNPTLRETLDLVLLTGGTPDPATKLLAQQISLPLSGPHAEGAEIIAAIRRGKATRIALADGRSALDTGLFGLLGAAELAVVPLFIEERLEGVILADNFITRRAIGPADLSLLKTFSGYAGVAFQRSRLYEELERSFAAQQEANRQLQKNQERLLQAEKLSAVGELAGVVSHEIRNPLVAIGGLARSALADEQENPGTREVLEIIVNEVSRLERFLKETLDFVKPRVRRLERVDLRAVVRECLATFKEELIERRVEPRLSLGETSIPARIDTNLLRGALSNLFKNAIEAMPLGGSLVVEARAMDGMSSLRVGDTGAGIPDEARPRIFDLFFTTKKTGTGLGLAMASQSLKSLGGTIRLDGAASLPTAPGETIHCRTVFTIELPLSLHEGDAP